MLLGKGEEERISRGGSQREEEKEKRGERFDGGERGGGVLGFGERGGREFDERFYGRLKELKNK